MTTYGETTYAVFTVQTQRRITHDRFLTDYCSDKYYTKFGLEYIDNITFNDIIKRHNNIDLSGNLFLNKVDHIK